MIFNDTIVVLAADEPPGLFPAREQMAVLLGWHIILACFGVAFPMMIFVMYRRAIRRTDPTALGLAKRWSKVTVNRILHSLIGDPPALEAASETTAPYVIPAVLFQPHIQRRLCWNDHHQDTEHQ